MSINLEGFVDGGFKFALIKLRDLLDVLLLKKYDKTGGEITGNVQIDGSLTLDIEDEDYDAGIRFMKALDNNAGTVLTVTGYANTPEESTSYRPVIRGVGSPQNNYDVANKAYVDSQIVRPDSYLVFLNDDGSIEIAASSLNYSKVKSELTNVTTNVYLDVIYQQSRLLIPAVQDQDVNNGPIVFMGGLRMSDGNIAEMVFLLDRSNQLTNYITLRENALLKTNDILALSESVLHYPTTKAVYDLFQRKPDVVWETDGTTGLVELASDDVANPAWQIQGLDLSPYKRVKVHALAGKGSTSASQEPAKVLEILLDDRGKSKGSGNYVGSTMFQNPNDRNRTGTLTCAVSADKTKFAVLRQTSLYGTAASSNSGTNSYVYLIEGYYD